jgi:hypothetical protein
MGYGMKSWLQVFGAGCGRLGPRSRDSGHRHQELPGAGMHQSGDHAVFCVPALLLCPMDASPDLDGLSCENMSMSS